MVAIGPADASEADAVLALQRLCYQSEAERYHDFAIPPLTQTLDELRHDYGTHSLLVAREAGVVVGSVRGRLIEGTCEIGRLIVDPDRQRRGLGTRLMRAIENEFSRAERYELFTGHRSEGNLRLYGRLGYVETRREVVSSGLTLVYLEKRPATPTALEGLG